MGVFLGKPKKEKEYESGEGNGLQYGLCAMQGWRVEMEDAHCVKIGLSTALANSSFFAVFDGHAGDFVSKYSSKHLIEIILNLWHSESENLGIDILNGDVSKIDTAFEDPEILEKLKGKIIEGFLKIDTDLKSLPEFTENGIRSGTTAVATFLTPKKVIFANCGDSRALLCSNNNIKFATSDHKPSNEKERKRIENAGGSVMVQRVNGTLAVSRALGDFDYKNSTRLPATEQLVSAEPDVDIIERSEDDEFLLLACDGVWDVMTNQEIVEYIRSRLLVHSDLNVILEELLETCLAKGSRDNMSAILITFPNAPKLCQEAVEKEAFLDSRIKEEIEKIVKSHGQDTKLNMVCDTLKECNLSDLPPCGGIQAKMLLIEKTLDVLVPERNEEQANNSNSGFNLPGMIRQLAQERELAFQRGGGGDDMDFQEEEDEDEDINNVGEEEVAP